MDKVHVKMAGASSLCLSLSVCELHNCMDISWLKRQRILEFNTLLAKTNPSYLSQILAAL